MTTLILDNYDSFTWNLEHAIAGATGVRPIVVRNDELSWEEITRLKFDNVVISPGPGTPANPRDFGICGRVIEALNMPMLGVCLGHQGICIAFGAGIAPAPEIMHGRISRIIHNGDPLFTDVPREFDAVRYHSLAAEALPACLERIAWTEAGVLMGVRHVSRPLRGLQFHPESVCTEYGDTILRNFLRLSGATLRTVHPVPAARPKPPVPDDLVRYSVVAREFPLEAAADVLFRSLFAGQPGAFWLDSSQPGGFSFMGAGEPRKCTAAFLRHELSRRTHEIPADLPFPFAGGWVGYFAYRSTGDPEGVFVFADRMLVIDHTAGRAWLVFCAPPGQADEAEAWLDHYAYRVSSVKVAQDENPAPPPMRPLEFAVAAPEYTARIKTCLDAIRAGESYEVCLTNQLRGTTAVDPLHYYGVLRKLNPAPFGAFLDFGTIKIACASPELFLRITKAGHVVSKPIKGTTGRALDATEDFRLREQLRHDEKSRAENLMIVDLVRNDLSRVCQPGTVRVPELMAIETFATVHQMVSTVEGQLEPGTTAIDCIRAAFPPGSMTGAPKLRTMEIIDSLETEPRGIYSGCLGFLGLDGAAEFNVVIRTAVFSGGEVSIGTGGAIVAQSDPAREWEELVLKTDALRHAFEATGRMENP